MALSKKNLIIGYIGLGLMGAPCVKRLCKHYRVKVWARRKSQANQLKKDGAVICAHPSELADCHIVFCNVSADKDVREITLGKEGLYQYLKAGSIVIDMSTISPDASIHIGQQLAKFGIDFLDAPVSGGTAGAQNGTLSFMVGGNENVLRQVSAVLKKLGKQITHIGPVGSGQVAKLCNQIIIGAYIEGISTAISLAQANDVDPQKVQKALLGGFAKSTALQIHASRMINHDFAPGFKASLHKKDLAIALANAKKFKHPDQIIKLFAKRLDILCNDGNQDLDSSASYLVLRNELKAKQK